MVMQDENPGTLASLVVGLVGAASGALGTYLARRYRIKAETALSEQRQLFGHYRRLVEDLQTHVARLQAEVKDLQQHYLDCRTENAALQAKIADLEKQVAQLKGRSSHTRP